MLLLGLVLLSAIAEVASLGAVLPFLGIITAPEQAFAHPFVSGIARALGVTAAAQLVLPLTILFVVTVLIAGSVRMLFLWASTRLSLAAGADLSVETYRRTLYQPYIVHVGRNSSEVISAITKKVDGVVFGVMLQTLVLVSSVVLVVAILAALLAIDPVVASVAAVGFGASYALTTVFTRRQLKRNGQLIAHGQTHLIKVLQDGLGGIRDVLLDGTQPVYSGIYQQVDYRLRRAQGNNTFIAQSPRFAMEALGMVLIAGLAYSLSVRGGIGAALPLLGALALGAQRLLPVLQQGYSAWASIIGNLGSLHDVLALLDQPVNQKQLEALPAPLELQDSIRLRDLSFRYSADGPWVLQGLDLRIGKGKRVGFVGTTGSGKSTALDLVMGLLQPTSGELLIDGVPLDTLRTRSWQRTIAHVPQSIYLADATLAENIAFGVPLDQIDPVRVRQAARQAEISDFIERSPDGYDAYVGERGIRLSGGQRQRIGIARALYKQATVLVFDEATSALDNATEQAVMETIESLGRDLTILMIAHRLSTVRKCDAIIELDHGKVVAQGTFDELLQSSASFRRMARDSV